MRWTCVAAAILAFVASFGASPSHADAAGKKRYSCPGTLPPDHAGGKPRHLAIANVFEAGFKYAIVRPDQINQDKHRIRWTLSPDYAPFGLLCDYDDQSETIVTIPMARFCEEDDQPGDLTVGYLFCE
jgi:hypothetical protein